MMKFTTTITALACAVFLQFGCSSTSTTISTDSSDGGVDNGLGDDEIIGNFNSSLFGEALTSATQENCTLDDGTVTTCMRLTFAANGAGDTEGAGGIGPYCPESTTTARNEAGFGSYDGATTPGFQSLVDAAVAMDADGYDIIDIDGNIRVDDLSGTASQDFSYCLEPSLDSSVELEFLIPVSPEFRDTPWQVGTIDSVGVGVLGVPYKGNPPSVTTVEAGVMGTGSGNIPALDHCGGHPDPFGYYHWHLVPQGANTLLASEAYQFTQAHGITCSNASIAFDQPSSFAGLAKDGFPIYGPTDSSEGVDVLPADLASLDACNGHVHATDEFSDGTYHYHAQADTAPNLPSCLMGKFVNNDVTVNGGAGGRGGPRISSKP